MLLQQAGGTPQSAPHLVRVLPDESRADKLEYATCLSLRAIQLLRTRCGCFEPLQSIEGLVLKGSMYPAGPCQMCELAASA